MYEFHAISFKKPLNTNADMRDNINRHVYGSPPGYFHNEFIKVGEISIHSKHYSPYCLKLHWTPVDSQHGY